MNIIKLKVIDKRHEQYWFSMSKMDGYWSICLKNANEHTVERVPKEQLKLLQEMVGVCLLENRDIGQGAKEKMAKELRLKGMTIREIARIMGFKHPGSISHLLKKNNQ